MEHRERDSGTIPTVAIVGCGRIGSWLDEKSHSGIVLSHAGAYQSSERVRLVALCDTNQERLSECGRIRGISARYLSYHTMLQAEKIDILSICTPTTQRLPLLQAVLEAGVKAIFLEKPIADSLPEAKQIAQLVSQHDAQVAVNYLRRWDSGIKELARLIKARQIGQIQHITAYYGKGILNNGSHLIDLLNLFFGLPFRVCSLPVIDDGYSDLDPTIDCVLEYFDGESSFSAYFVASNYQHFSLFELDIVGTMGRARITEKGKEIQLYSVEKDVTFLGYSALKRVNIIPSDLEYVMASAVEELIDLHQGKCSQPSCGINEAIEVLGVVEALRESLSCGSKVEVTSI